MGLIDKFKDFFYYSQEEETAKVPSEWKKRRQWNAVPLYNADEVVLIVAKFVLTSVQTANDNADQYAEDSIVRRHTAFYTSTMMSMLRGTIAGFERLADTPVGDKVLLDALDLVREQVRSCES